MPSFADKLQFGSNREKNAASMFPFSQAENKEAAGRDDTRT